LNSDSQPRALSLDELPKFSRWPAILLGSAPFPKKQRTPEQILREYDQEKWGSVLRVMEQGDVAEKELAALQGINPNADVAFSRGSELFTAKLSAALAQNREILAKALSGFQATTLVELGSGLGDKLIFLGATLGARNLYGGEYTSSGVQCGRLLAKYRGVRARFEHFDYNDPKTLAHVPEKALVFTSHSIEQIPELGDGFLEGLMRKDPVAVVHFEPCHEDQDESTLIGLMRRRYAEINDYNRNLVGLLRRFEKKGQIEILRHEKNIFGISPLNPTSILVWKPK
jgi:hypothetical protein